jgi:hypothetical protein
MSAQTFQCGHEGDPARGRVCVHLLADHDLDRWQRFTGSGKECDWVCDACAADPEQREASLRAVCSGCFQTVEAEIPLAGIIGEPEVVVRVTSLRYVHRIVRLAEPLHADILDLQPINALPQPVCLAITSAGSVVSLDLGSGAVRTVASLPQSNVDLSEPVTLHLSADGQMAALVNTRGQHGVVLDVQSGRATMRLDRGSYLPEQSNFPAAFFKPGGRLLLVHGTDWNRLDVSDPRTGELLTPREPTSYRDGEPMPEHYLDYFHGGLLISPQGEWIADNGWIWHPAGTVVTWNLRRWLEENVWEAEDGPTRKELCQRTYFWDGPLCWIDETTLAVWGYGEDDRHLRPAVLLFDVETGGNWPEPERWFPGPQGTLVFDEYLFSYSPEQGTAVWDIATGERLLQDPQLCPAAYHRGARRFISPRDDGTFVISALTGAK